VICCSRAPSRRRRRLPTTSIQRPQGPGAASQSDVSEKPVLVRDLAHRDVEAAVDCYAREVGPDIARGFIDALQSTYQVIAEHPGLGSPRYSQELALLQLYNSVVKGFPYLVFYIECNDHIDVWRVLHGRPDIPFRMQDPEA
jgi:toxin ParE1/3/4